MVQVLRGEVCSSEGQRPVKLKSRPCLHRTAFIQAADEQFV